MRTSGKRMLAVLACLMLGMWGCAEGPSATSAVERVKALESKNAKLEEDYRAAVAARDGLKKKLAALEEQKAQAQQEAERLQAKVRQNEGQLRARTSERDLLQGQFELFRKGIKDLLGQADAALNPPATPAGTANLEGNPNKS